VRVKLLVPLAVAQAVGLALLAGAQAPASILPGDAPLHEGEPRVAVAGLLGALRPSTSGGHASLAAAGQSLEIQSSVPLPPAGSWAEATGRLARVDGILTLLADHVDSVPPPGVPHPAWATVADSPGSWTDTAFALTGTVSHGTLSDGDGHHVALGAGAWPASGAVTAVGRLRADPACLCHRFDAATVGAAP